MKNRNKLLPITFLLLFTFSCKEIYSQHSDLQLKKVNSFISESKNIIINPEALNPFFDQLKKSDSTQIEILQIGDSHIQADQMTTIIRQNFHKDFGDAGRGFIFPYELAQSNGSLDVKATSTGVWSHKRCVHPEKPEAIGIGGVTLINEIPYNNIKINTYNNNNLNNSFNTLKIWYKQNPKQSISITSTEKITHEKSADNMAYYTWENPVNEVVINTHKPSSDGHNYIFGLSISRDVPGVIYHSIGANGAQFQHYNKGIYFHQQLGQLNPSLLIISLGTNEVNDKKSLFSSDKFRQDALIFFEKIRAILPHTPILVTIPAESYRNEQPNLDFEKVQAELLKLAEEYDFAVWDLYTIAGGKNSALLWKKNGLIKKDGVHFTAIGYEIQGNLMYNAILKSFLDYNHK